MVVARDGTRRQGPGNLGPTAGSAGNIQSGMTRPRRPGPERNVRSRAIEAFPSRRILVGFLKHLDHGLPRAGLPQKTHETLVFQMARNILQGSEMVAGLVLG